MSMRSDYEEYLQKQNKLKGMPFGKFWINQEARYVKPFRIYGKDYLDRKIEETRKLMKNPEQN